MGQINPSNSIKAALIADSYACSPPPLWNRKFSTSNLGKPWPGLAHDDPVNPKRAFWKLPALQTPPIFHQKTPRESTESEISSGRRKQKVRNFGPPHFWAPPFGAPSFWALTFSGFGPPALLFAGALAAASRPPTVEPPTLAASFQNVYTAFAVVCAALVSAACCCFCCCFWCCFSCCCCLCSCSAAAACCCSCCCLCATVAAFAAVCAVFAAAFVAASGPPTVEPPLPLPSKMFILLLLLFVLLLFLLLLAAAFAVVFGAVCAVFDSVCAAFCAVFTAALLLLLLLLLLFFRAFGLLQCQNNFNWTPFDIRKKSRTSLLHPKKDFRIPKKPHPVEVRGATANSIFWTFVAHKKTRFVFQAGLEAI